ncbi:LysR family transcriptional regulator [uncultured Roseibium sp.]|uniref:LysR family transcriptional regulator n=1 Tax=uncultured Roseibium sp. TaxID=1936171 RepID=UPI0026194811|nr:LysR family transcriptional regulator [uncultured Roseibium sp.]
MANNHDDPSLDDLSVLLSVLEEGGFRAASKRLGISPSNVSETVSRLEARLGVPLLLRTTRSVMPTEAGRSLAERITPLIAETRAALADAASSKGRVSGRLTLNVPGAVVPDILPPIIDRFLLLHPDVKVELVIENSLVDAIAKGCDAGIRYGEQLAQDMISVPIGPRSQQLALAAAPAYLAARTAPCEPEELLDHDCIRYRLPSGPLLPWELRKGKEAITVDPRARLIVSVNSVHTAIIYARLGHGIIRTFRNWLEDDFDAGTLRPVLQDWWPTVDGPRLYYPGRLAPAPLRAFIELVARERSPT